jgi:hypothetical protein
MSVLLEWTVHVRALCSYAEGDKLMVLVVVDNCRKAKQALGRAGFECKINPVIVVGLDNHLGATARLGQHLNNAGIQILYSYASYMHDAQIVAVFKTQDDARAMEVLESILQVARSETSASALVQSAAA